MTKKDEALKILNESLDELDYVEDVTANYDGDVECWQSKHLGLIIKTMREAIKILND